MSTLRGRPRATGGHDDGGGHDGGAHGSGREISARYQVQTLWIPFVLLLLAAFLVAAPFTFGYASLRTVPVDVAEVTRDRGLAGPHTRAAWATVNDVVSGAALAVFALLSLSPRRVWSRWAACGVGVWLLFAPLVLWAPTPAAYVTDTLLGMLVIAFTILIPAMPGMMRIMQSGPEVPPGWSYNPSSWFQRAPVIALGFVGFFLSRYLAAFQLGYIGHAGDPFFGMGSVEILTSDVSRAWPISDAGLGTAAYAIEALMGFMGGTSRWRTMPWMVTFFGILVIPLSFTSILLVILQPVAVGTWCTWCLVTAAAMLVMIPLTVDEVVAMGQFVLRRRREGDRTWDVFWKGGTVEGGGEDERSPGWPASAGDAWRAGTWGMGFPLPLVATAALGVFLMAAPTLFGARGAWADSNHLVGALIVCVAVIAMADLARLVRYANIVLGGWTVAGGWLLAGGDTGAALAATAVGAVVVALSLPAGATAERFGTAQRWVR